MKKYLNTKEIIAYGIGLFGMALLTGWMPDYASTYFKDFAFKGTNLSPDFISGAITTVMFVAGIIGAVMEIFSPVSLAPSSPEKYNPLHMQVTCFLFFLLARLPWFLPSHILKIHDQIFSVLHSLPELHNKPLFLPAPDLFPPDTLPSHHTHNLYHPVRNVPNMYSN